MKKKKKKIGPKTKPTGFVPKGARPAPRVEPVCAQTVKAWRAKVVYMQERGRWESLKSGGLVKYQPPKSYDGKAAVRIDGEEAGELEKAKASVWQKLVDWCEARKLPTETYIRHCFSLVPLTLTSAPEPRQIMGDKYHTLWRKTKGKRRAEMTVSLNVQKDTCRRHLTVRQGVYGETPEFAQMYILADGAGLGLSPLFCYCLSFAIGTKKMRRLARRLEAEAILQFETARGLYKKVWSGMLPAGFAEKSKIVYPYLLAKLWAVRKTDAVDGDG